MSGDRIPRGAPTAELVTLAQKGERDAAEELFSRYAGRVLEISRMRLGPRLRAELESADIGQQALADAFRRLEGFEMRDESSLLRWLARFVENAVHASLRYHGAARRDQAGSVPLSGGEGSRELTISSALPTPSVEIGRAEAAEAVREAVAELPERYREVVLLREYAGSPWEEVGRELGGLSPGAARMLHSRALAKLGAALREKGID